jgi:hypothetical protein
MVAQEHAFHVLFHPEVPLVGKVAGSERTVPVLPTILIGCQLGYCHPRNKSPSGSSPISASRNLLYFF